MRPPRRVPTCPGARTGPGGAPAFPAAPAANAAAGGRRPRRAAGAGRPAVAAAGRARGACRAGRGRAAIWALAPPRYSRVSNGPESLARAAPAAPLTPEQQVWFNAGETVYKNLCQACHQADGRGQDKVAASLVGSAFALGRARDRGADHAEWQGGKDRAHAATRGRADRRSDRRRADLRAASVGERGVGGRSSRCQAGPQR